MSADKHWERIWTINRPKEVSWFEPEPSTCLELMGAVALQHNSKIVDIGGVASTLSDELLDRGFEHLPVVDLAESSLSIARARLGLRPTASGVPINLQAER